MSLLTERLESERGNWQAVLEELGYRLTAERELIDGVVAQRVGLRHLGYDKWIGGLVRGEADDVLDDFVLALAERLSEIRPALDVYDRALAEGTPPEWAREFAGPALDTRPKPPTIAELVERGYRPLRHA